MAGWISKAHGIISCITVSIQILWVIGIGDQFIRRHEPSHRRIVPTRPIVVNLQPFLKIIPIEAFVAQHALVVRPTFLTPWLVAHLGQRAAAAAGHGIHAAQVIDMVERDGIIIWRSSVPLAHGDVLSDSRRMAIEEIEAASLARVAGIVPLIVAANRDGDLLARAEFFDQRAIGVVEELGDSSLNDNGHNHHLGCAHSVQFDLFSTNILSQDLTIVQLVFSKDTQDQLL